MGTILCTDKKHTEVEYAIQNINQPLGVSTYTMNDTLPEELEGILPKPDELAEKLEREEEKNAKGTS